MVWLFPLAVVILIPTFAAVGLCRPILRYADESLLYTQVAAIDLSPGSKTGYGGRSNAGNQ